MIFIGKSTGIISTVHLVHASPAGAYAHVPERNWYSDSRMSQESLDSGCADIAKQFYNSSHMVTVSNFFQNCFPPKYEFVVLRGVITHVKILRGMWACLDISIA